MGFLVACLQRQWLFAGEKAGSKLAKAQAEGVPILVDEGLHNAWLDALSAGGSDTALPLVYVNNALAHRAFLFQYATYDGVSFGQLMTSCYRHCPPHH